MSVFDPKYFKKILKLTEWLKENWKINLKLGSSEKIITMEIVIMALEVSRMMQDG